MFQFDEGISLLVVNPYIVRYQPYKPMFCFSKAGRIFTCVQIMQRLL